MLHPYTLDLARSALAIIDMQEAFRDKIPDFAAAAKRIALMVQAAKLLNLPVIISADQVGAATLSA